MIHRRQLFQTTLALGATAKASQAWSQSQAVGETMPQMNDQISKSFTRPVFIATWKFGLPACQKSMEVMLRGQSVLDAVERGINVAELDESVDSVGVGGLPNADGVVQLDACFMDGKSHKAGSVAGLENYPNPISVARRVMETTRHVMLVGEDAAKFANKNGFQSRELLTESSRKRWLEWKETQQANRSSNPPSHDTISLLGISESGHLCGGCSTSGLAFKLPGRVGDSPLIGSGMYVDGRVGAAGATGVGENILRYCGSFLIVEMMRLGQSPTDACESAIRRIAFGDNKMPEALSVNFIAINKEGVVGAAGTDRDFVAAVVDRNRATLIQPRWVR